MIPRVRVRFDLLSQSPEAYVIVFALALGDGVFPAFPSETALIIAGLLSVVGELQLGWVIAAGATGAFAGDSLSYGLGRYVGRPAQQRFLDGRRARAALEWASGQLRRARRQLVIVAPLRPWWSHRCDVHRRHDPLPVPQVRSPSTRSPRSRGRRTPRCSGTSAAASSSTTSGLALLLAFGTAAAVALAVEGVRRLRR